MYGCGLFGIGIVKCGVDCGGKVMRKWSRVLLLVMFGMLVVVVV